MTQCFEITLNIVAIMFIFKKISAIHFDNLTENKLAFRIHMVFLFWAIVHCSLTAAQFFINPNKFFLNYISHSTNMKELTEENYQ